MANSEFFESPKQFYNRSSLRRSSLARNPLVLFHKWLEEAIRSYGLDAYSTILATANGRGHPSARVVLLKQVEPAGFVFFTNYQSPKGCDLKVNPYAAMVFYWSKMQRQIRVAGLVERTSEGESNTYFKSRPRGSRIASLVSSQSSVIKCRESLEKKYRRVEKLPSPERPDNWGGFRLKPSALEFWQGRPNRLHDRFLYKLQSDDSWKIERLAP